MAAQPKRKALSSDADPVRILSLLAPTRTFVIIGRENKLAVAPQIRTIGDSARQESVK
jgi:hypothetical protein